MGAACETCRPNSKGEVFIKEIVSSLKFNDFTYKDFILLIEKFFVNFNENNELIYKEEDVKLMNNDSTFIVSNDLFGNGRFSNNNHSDKTTNLLYGLKTFLENNFCLHSIESKWFMYHIEMIPDIESFDLCSHENCVFLLFAWGFSLFKPFSNKAADLIAVLQYIYGASPTKKQFDKFISQMVDFAYVYLPRRIIKHTLKEYKSNKGLSLNDYEFNSELQDQLNSLYSEIFNKQKAFEFNCSLLDKASYYLQNDEVSQESLLLAALSIERFLYVENILDHGFYLYSLKT